MATIRKRRGPEGRTVWQAQIIRIGHKPQYRTFDRRGEAEAWARKTEADIQSGDWIDRSEGDRTTVKDALERYKLEIIAHKSPATRQRETLRATWLQEQSFARIALSRLTGRDVADYIRHREQQGIGGNALRRELAVLSHLYTVARSAWGMAYLANPVPLARTALPPVPRGRTRRLKKGEEEKLLESAPAGFAPVIRFALATAMRRGEIAALRWEYVDLKRRVVFLPTSKNEEARSVPLSPDAIKVLKELKPKEAGPVFEVRANTLTQNMIEACQRAGIEDMTFHDLRHEAISRFFEDTDLDMMEIKAITGHKTLQMLARYTHLRTHRLADRLAGMGRTGKRAPKRHEA